MIYTGQHTYKHLITSVLCIGMEHFGFIDVLSMVAIKGTMFYRLFYLKQHNHFGNHLIDFLFVALWILIIGNRYLDVFQAKWRQNRIFTDLWRLIVEKSIVQFGLKRNNTWWATDFLNICHSKILF